MNATDSPPPLLGALMRRPVDVIHRRIIEALHANGFDDLVPAHMAVLRYPGPDGQRPVDLAAQANMSKQALNYLLGQLEELGYVERRDDPEDSRSKRVYVTARGDSTRKVIRDAVRAVEAEWEEVLGAEDFEHMRATLLRLHEFLDESSDVRSRARATAAAR